MEITQSISINDQCMRSKEAKNEHRTASCGGGYEPGLLGRVHKYFPGLTVGMGVDDDIIDVLCTGLRLKLRGRALLRLSVTFQGRWVIQRLSLKGCSRPRTLSGGGKKKHVWGLTSILCCKNKWHDIGIQQKFLNSATHTGDTEKIFFF